MTESFVDLSYRGLSLGRRIKLTQVRPSTGYLEHPTPMPVGTAIAITTDEGVALDALVTQVYEQVGGSDRLPGMVVKPMLAEQALAAWWSQRVTLPEQEAPRVIARTKPVTVRPRSHTVVDAPPPPPAPPDAAIVDTQVTPVLVLDGEPEVAPEPPVEGRKTTVMNAVHQELLEELTRTPDEVEQLTRTSGEHAVVDDGQRTMAMDAVDISALGLDASGPLPVASSGSLAALDDDEADGEGPDSGPLDGGAADDDKKPKGFVKRRKKKR